MLEVTVVTKKKNLRPETERFKHILIKAYQRGELSANMTAKDMVWELVHQLKPIFKGNNHK
jgi:predicted HTH domain antitoxin